MADIEIDAPDGSVVSFPEGTPDSVIVSVMRKSYPPAQDSADSAPAAMPPIPQNTTSQVASSLADKAAVLGTDVGKSILGSALPHAVVNALNAPYTALSNAAAFGTQAGEYLARPIVNMISDNPVSLAAMRENGQYLMADILKGIGVKNVDPSKLPSGPAEALSRITPSGALEALAGDKLYQPQTLPGQIATVAGQIAGAGFNPKSLTAAADDLASGAGTLANSGVAGKAANFLGKPIESAVKAISTPVGNTPLARFGNLVSNSTRTAIPVTLAPEAVKALGGGEDLQFGAGLAAGALGAKVQNNKITNAQAKQTVEKLPEVANALITRVKESGAALSPQASSRLAEQVRTAVSPDMMQAMKDFGKAGELETAINAISKYDGQPIPINQLTSMDAVLNSMISEHFTKGKQDANGVNLLKIKDVVRKAILNPEDGSVIDASGKIVPSGSSAATDYKNFTKLYTQKSKLDLLEEIKRKSEVSDDPGMAERKALQALYKDRKELRGWSAKEIAALKTAATSGGLQKLLSGMTNPWIAGSVGAILGGPGGAMGAAGAAATARQWAKPPIDTALQLPRMNALRNALASSATPIVKAELTRPPATQSSPAPLASPPPAPTPPPSAPQSPLAAFGAMQQAAQAPVARSAAFTPADPYAMPPATRGVQAAPEPLQRVQPGDLVRNAAEIAGERPAVMPTRSLEERLARATQIPKTAQQLATTQARLDRVAGKKPESKTPLEQVAAEDAFIQKHTASLLGKYGLTLNDPVLPMKNVQDATYGKSATVPRSKLANRPVIDPYAAKPARSGNVPEITVTARDTKKPKQP